MSDYPKYYTAEESYFPYVDEVSEDMHRQILEAAQSAVSVFKIPETKDGRELARSINNVVDKILRTGEYPKEYYNNDITLAAVELGCLYGFALCMGYGWKWKAVGQSPDKLTFTFGVGSEDDKWYNPCAVYVNKILTGQNHGIDGRNDNTILLLYNMIEETIKKEIPEKKLTVLW